MELFKLNNYDTGTHDLGGVIILTSCKDRMFVTECNLAFYYSYSCYNLFFPNTLVVSGGDDNMKLREGMVLAGLYSYEHSWDNLYNVTNEYTLDELEYFRKLKKLCML